MSAFAACVRINIRTAAGVSTYADAGTLPALITRPPLRRPSYILRGILAPFPLLVLVLVRYAAALVYLRAVFAALVRYIPPPLRFYQHLRLAGTFGG